MTTKTTCGPLFEKVVERFCPGVIPVEFYAGFIAGHAEKVWMGACPASMFRPPLDRRKLAAECIVQICTIYNLRWAPVLTSRGDEFWIYRDEWVADDLRRLRFMYASGKENNHHWHGVRGRLTGVPVEEIDYSFHERQHAESY